MTIPPTTDHTPIEKFLSVAIRTSLRLGLHTPEQFMARFPPDAIMHFLDTESEKRSMILAPVLGIAKKTSQQLPTAAAGNLLQVAYDAGDAPAGKILEVLHPLDIARHFTKAAVWAFIVHGDWWKKSKADVKPARDFMEAMIAAGWTNGLLKPEDVLDRIGIAQLTRALPKDLLEHLVDDAAKAGLRQEPFAPQRIFKIVEAHLLVQHLPLEVLYNSVLVPIANEQELIHAEVPATRKFVGPPSAEAAAVAPTALSPGPAAVPVAKVELGKRTQMMASPDKGSAEPAPAAVDANWSAPPPADAPQAAQKK